MLIGDPYFILYTTLLLNAMDHFSLESYLSIIIIPLCRILTQLHPVRHFFETCPLEPYFPAACIAKDALWIILRALDLLFEPFVIFLFFDAIRCMCDSIIQREEAADRPPASRREILQG
jgi:hypothetical protein